VRKGRKISAVFSLLDQPLVAVALGALLGVLLTFISQRAVSFMTPEDPMRGLAVVAAVMGARFAIAIAALAAYSASAPGALVFFGPALALSFVVGLVFEAARASWPHESRTSA